MTTLFRGHLGEQWSPIEKKYIGYDEVEATCIMHGDSGDNVHHSW